MKQANNASARALSALNPEEAANCKRYNLTEQQLRAVRRTGLQLPHEQRHQQEVKAQEAARAEEDDLYGLAEDASLEDLFSAMRNEMQTDGTVKFAEDDAVEIEKKKKKEKKKNWVCRGCGSGMTKEDYMEHAGACLGSSLVGHKLSMETVIRFGDPAQSNQDTMAIWYVAHLVSAFKVDYCAICQGTHV